MGLMRRLVLGDLDLTAYPFSIEFDEDHGSPENVYDTLVSMLADGELMSSTRVSSREISLTVLVEGPTLADLALNEAALVAECEKQRSTLTVDPGDSYAPSSVFDIFRVQARLLYDANLEQANFRRYSLTIPALPYARSADLVVTPAQTATETVIDDGTATTDWTASTGTLSVVSGAVRVSYTQAGPATVDVAMTRQATVSLTGKPYIAVTWLASSPVKLGPDLALVDATPTLPGSGWIGPSLRIDAGSGKFTSFYTLPAGTTTTGFVSVRWALSTLGAVTFDIDKVSTWTGLPATGSARQRALAIVPGGSVRTQGSIQVAHATNALGKTIVYTHPSGTGYLPPLRPWRVSSEAVTADAALVSGSRNAIGPTTRTDYRVPVAVLPEGRVEVWAWLRAVTATGAAAVEWSVTSVVNALKLSEETRTTTVTFAATNTWYLVPLGVAVMPPLQVGPSGHVGVSLFESPATKGVQVDEAYLFATDAGRLSIVDCGTAAPSAGGTSNRLWIDAPSLDQPQGGIYRGNAADRSDSWHAGSLADVWQVHDFDPAGTNIFVATPNTVDAETSLEHYKRFHTHVAAT